MDIIEEVFATLLGGLFIMFSIIGLISFLKRCDEFLAKEQKKNAVPKIITLDDYTSMRRDEKRQDNCIR